jgi:hypothetical protein
MEKESKKQVENTDSNNEKLLLSDVNVCCCSKMTYNYFSFDNVKRCVECGKIKHNKR